MQNADAFVAASKWENCSVSLLESLACGLPAATTCTGISEYIINDENGALVDSTTPDDIVKAMRVILNGDYNRADIHKNTRALFYPQVFAERIKGMLDL